MESTKMGSELFGNLMNSLFINYRQKVDKKLIDLFWSEFKNISEERFCHAIKDVREIEEYFPSVATINKYLKSAPVENELWEWPTLDEVAKKAISTGQLAKDCLRIIFLKLNGELNHQQYYEEMLKLDVKYPNIVEWVHGKKIDRSFKKQAEMFLHGERDKVLYQRPGLRSTTTRYKPVACK